MPALPWVERHAIDRNRNYMAMASRLPLKSYRHIPGFLRDATRIRRQLADTPGLLGYGLNAQWPTRPSGRSPCGRTRPASMPSPAPSHTSGSPEDCNHVWRRPDSSSCQSPGTPSR